MRWSATELYDRASKVTSRLQDDSSLFRRFREKYQLDDLEFWLVTRFRFFPASVTPNDFLSLGPYTSVSKYQRALGTLTEKMLVERPGAGRYRLTDAGRKSIGDTYSDYFARVARLSYLPDDDVEALYRLADRTYLRALRQSDVPVTLMSAAHSVLPDIDSTWVQLERRMVGLAIYRDDSHIAAWREAGYTGPRIELSTALFRAENGLTYDELRAAAARLDDQDFLSALSALHSGGEATQRGERYRLTPAGHGVRQAIKDATDRNYARPFVALGEDLDYMIELLDRLIAAPA